MSNNLPSGVLEELHLLWEDDVPIRKAADLTGLDRNTVIRHYNKWRTQMGYPSDIGRNRSEQETQAAAG